MARLDYDRASTVLVEAAYFGDKQAAERNGISVKTVERYRKRLETDVKLSEFVQLKKAQFEASWAEDVSLALKKGVDFFNRVFDKASVMNAQTIHAAAGAFKILFEAKLTKDVLDARLSRYIGEESEENRQMAAIIRGRADEQH